MLLLTLNLLVRRWRYRRPGWANRSETNPLLALASNGVGAGAEWELKAAGLVPEFQAQPLGATERLWGLFSSGAKHSPRAKLVSSYGYRRQRNRHPQQTHGN